MHILSSETIGDVDSMAHAYVVDYWSPTTIETGHERDRLAKIETDLNLLDMPETDGRRSSLPGRDEAMYVVLTDLAMKASSIMKAVDPEEMENMDGVDDSVAKNPVLHDLTPQEKQADADYKARNMAEHIAFHGAPPPSLIDRGPISDDTATRITDLASGLIDDEKWKKTKDPRGHQDTVIMVDRIGRLDRNRKAVVDPEIRAAYDLMRNDMAVKIADNLAKALTMGAVKSKHIGSDDLRMLRDPQNPTSSRIVAQAAAIQNTSVSASKGPAQAPDLVTASRGASAER